MPSRLAALVPDATVARWLRVRRLLRRHRRLVVAALVATCVAAGLRSVSPPAPTLVAVTVAAHDLPGGSVLRPSDLTRARLPPAAVPAGTLPVSAVGRTLAGPVRSGEPVTDVRLIGAGLVASLAPGMVATPVRLADSAIGSLISPGDLVDVLAAPADPAARTTTTVVATGVRVLAVPPPAVGAATDDGSLVLLATSRPEALALAVAATAERLSITWTAQP